jgi:two-component system cell cycle sensor histidine kinase/response regulator CckA
MAEKPTYTELKQKIKVLEQEAIKLKQTEEMLLQSEEKHRRIFENLQDVYYEADMGGTILEISPSIEKLSQYKREELIGKSLYDIYTNPNERDEFVKLILDKGKVNDYEIHLEDKDGSLRFCSITTLLIRDSQGTPEKIIGSMRNIAENKLAEELLRESEERFRNVYDIAPLAFVLWDRNTRVTDWNKKAEEIFGWSKEEVVGHNFFDFLIPEKNRPRVEDVVNSLLKGDILSHSINENLTKEGKIITCEWNNSAFHDDNGNIMGAISLGLDITEQKLAEEALRESEGQLLSVFRVAPTGIGVAVDRVLKQVNERICEMTGHSEIELIGQNARILYQSDEDYEYVGREKYKQITAHGTGTVETRWKHKDGRIIDVLLSSTPMDLDDLSKGVTFTALDITERKRTREALRIAHERFLTVLESIDATIYVADMETHEILFMNKNMIESFGRDMTGEMCWEVFRGESEPCQDCTNDQLIDKNRKPTGVCVWQGKNPITGKWYINHDRAIEWTDGRLVRLEIATDITNFKRMEQQLQQTDKFEAIGTLAGGLAHDFNNLLMGIQGRASLMSVDLEPSHSHSEHINAIEDYIRSATDLTRQLLGFARGGKYEVKPTDINNLVHNCAKMFNRTRKETRLHAKFQDPPPVVAVDQRQIEQVLLNLFINAWQAMPGGGELYLETQIVALDDAYCKPYKVKPGRYAKVSVTDTGIGMNESVSQRIFDPFFTTKEKGRGTGLGLASAYGIIKNHDGIITVYSEVGHGTTFNIYLPLSDKEAYREAPLESRLIKGSETVLIVDDEEMILEVGQAMLETLGYRIVVADGGEQAVDVVKRKGNEIDLVILDLIMPGMNGSEVFDRIREIRPQMSVVLSSGYAINGQADEIMKRGCNGFIQKPFNISELSQKVRQILDEAKSSA